MGRTRFSKDINQFLLKSFVNSLSFIPIKRRPLCLIVFLPWLQIRCSSQNNYKSKFQFIIFNSSSSSSVIFYLKNEDFTLNRCCLITFLLKYTCDLETHVRRDLFLGIYFIIIQSNLI